MFLKMSLNNSPLANGTTDNKNTYINSFSKNQQTVHTKAINLLFIFGYIS